MGLKQLPTTIIGGYLGAGKTTLLNHLLRHNDGRRLAVLVNDFGDINIDAELITSHDGETMQLANGCICCTMADGYLQALGQLRARAATIDQIIVEASGVANPTRLAQTSVALQFVVDGVIVVVDAEQIRERAANKYVGETVIRQIQGADLLVLNKADLASPAQLAAVRDWLAETAGDVPIVESRHGAVPPTLLFGLHPRTELPPGGEPPGLRLLEADSDHKSLYETGSFTSETPLDGDAFRRWAAALPPEIIRAKGVVFLTDDPTAPHVYQRAGRRWSLSPAETDRATAGVSTTTRIVLIGLPGSIDAANTAALREDA